MTGLYFTDFDPFLYANALVSLSFSSLSLTLPEWPFGSLIVSRERVHLKGYPDKARLELCLWKAFQLDMIVTVCPSLWNRLSERFKKLVFAAKLPLKRVFLEVKDFFFYQLHQWIPLRDVQRMIFEHYGYKLKIKRLKFWIMRRKHGREKGSHDIHYWSVQW